MAAIGIAVLALAGFGVKQHLATQAAWNERFNRPKATARTPEPIPFETQADDPVERIRQIRKARERAELELRERDSWRCINGTPFRKIPGGWENVPGQRC